MLVNVRCAIKRFPNSYPLLRPTCRGIGNHADHSIISSSINVSFIDCIGCGGMGSNDICVAHGPIPYCAIIVFDFHADTFARTS